MFVSF